MNRLRWVFGILLVCNCCLFGGAGLAVFALPGVGGGSSGATIKVGFSPEKEQLFTQLVEGFNKSGTPHRIEAKRLDPDTLVETAVSGELVAISPDSAVWLDQIDRAWKSQRGDDAILASSLTRYAASPIVLASTPEAAARLGHPARPVRWQTLIDAAGAGQIRWSHPASTQAMGLLALTAEFYTAAGNPQKLSREDVQRPEVVERVRQIERTVQQYGGETEDALLQRMLQPGGRNVDVFVAQEQFVVRFNRETTGEKLVAIYPADGTMWLDHPLALLDGPWVTPDARVAYRAFVSYLSQTAVGQQVLAAGYRPADVRLAIDEAASPIRPQNGVDPSQPFTTLPLPSTAVLESIRESWSLLKRRANIILVVDISGSMAGERMRQAQEALLSFVSQIRDGRDRVSLITFSSDVRTAVPLDTMDKNRASLERSIRGIQTGGNTALYDAIDEAVTTLTRRREADRINVVLAMTDGEVNQSARNLLPNRGDPSRLIEVIGRTMQGAVPVAVYTVAYGGEAEYDVLKRIATSTKGQAYRSDPDTIRRLYRLLSAEF